MTTYVSGLYNINGVISTDKSVMQNLNALCTSAGAWMTYDISDGKWSVVINRAGTSVASFSDSNIIGGINVSSTGVNELYNSVTLEFPHKDLRDQTDYIDFDIPTVDRFPNELDNRLNMSVDLVNDPIQAAYLASAELKQSRVDKIIEFRTDFSKLGLKAGDLIDVTNTMYGYTNKIFRIIKMQEEDAEGLVISITALEYDTDVYSTDGLTRTLREKKTGITPIISNTAVIAKDNAGTANGLTNFFSNPLALGALGIPAILSLLGSMSKVTGGTTSRPGLSVSVRTFGTGAVVIDELAFREFTFATFQAPLSGYYKVQYQINWGGASEMPGVGNLSPPHGVIKGSEITLTRNGSSVDLGPWASTGDTHVQLYEDHIVVGTFGANAGQTLVFGGKFYTNFGPSYNEYFIDFQGGTSGLIRYVSASTNRAAIYVTADVQYLGT